MELKNLNVPRLKIEAIRSNKLNRSNRMIAKFEHSSCRVTFDDFEGQQHWASARSVALHWFGTQIILTEE